MSDIVISAENLGKAYTIGHQVQRGKYTALRDVIVQNARSLWHKTRDLAQGKPLIMGDTHEEVWALKDVNFEIRRGEAVGIIGRNGAGKSTLLKILSRITEPSAGRVTIKGRVASLLEVGTGFHPELTGRENIYLNGAILGMTRQEIKRKFDEIVAFAEVEKYLDTPVKRYSSGMYVRLAFAVAAHLEPEILVVDEVLAVGDAEFQRKCLGKMGDVATEGRTVLFVSHNMAAIQQLCQRGMVLHNGQAKSFTRVTDAVDDYLENIRVAKADDLDSRKDRKGSQRLRFSKVGFFDVDGHEIQHIRSGQDVLIKFFYIANLALKKATVNVAFNVRNEKGILLTNLNSNDTGGTRMDLHPYGYLQCHWPNFNLKHGSYDCALYCAVDGQVEDWLQSAFTLNVEDGDFFNTGRLANRNHGDFLVSHSWSSHIGQSQYHEYAEITPA